MLAYLSPGYGAYLNVDEKMIAKALIVDSKTMSVESGIPGQIQHHTFKIDNALVFKSLSKVFTDTDAYVYVKQRKGIQDDQAVFFDVNKHFLGPEHVVRQATKAKGKLRKSHYDGKRKMWDWNKYATPIKEQYVIMKSIKDFDYSEMDNGRKVCHFLQGIRSTKLEETANVVLAQTKKYDMDFDATVCYLGQMVTKKGPSMQSVYIAKTGSQPEWPNMAKLHGKVECKTYPKAV